MKEHMRLIVLICILLACATLGFLRVYETVLNGFIERFSKNETSSILFTGDIMLARDVEDRMRAVGTDVFFDLVRPLHERAQYVVANFEAAVPSNHVPTPDLTFQFSVDSALLPSLRSAHVTHVSLANNHADDYGVQARHESIDALSNAGFIPFGQPRGIASTSITTITIDGKRIAVIGVEDVLQPLDLTAAQNAIHSVATTSDVQVVFVHWGNEYELTHSARQEVLARMFIDAGADAVIGHHPHVVQDIAVINGVPVIYSLGNYVFDQYWDDEVQRGLTVLLSVTRDSLSIELVPIRTDRARPRVLTLDESRAFLHEIAEHSEESSRSAIVRGVITGRLQ